MARRNKSIIWTEQGRNTLDEAVEYLAKESLTAAQNLLLDTLNSVSSLSTLSDRGRVVPELHQQTIREIFVQRYRLIYQVFENRIEILAFIHGSRDFNRYRNVKDSE